MEGLDTFDGMSEVGCVILGKLTILKVESGGSCSYNFWPLSALPWDIGYHGTLEIYIII